MEHDKKKTHRQNNYFVAHGAFQDQESG